MRTHSSWLLGMMRKVWFGFWLVATLTFHLSRLLAQCSPDAGYPDAACGTLGSAPALATRGSDRSTEASAENSLSSGAAYGEPRAIPSGSSRTPAAAASAEPITEFQRFVAATTGELLPIYAAGLFEHATPSFAAIEDVPAPLELVIAPEDELRVRVWGQVNFSANLRVSREGEIYLPKVGAVHVAGLKFSDLNGSLRQALEPVYRNFELSIGLGEIHSIPIYVTGQARNPGQYTISALSSLVDAVFSSGGPAASGSMRHVLLRRNGKVIADYDLYALLVGGDKSGDVPLQSGDVLYFPACGKQVAMLGSLRQAGIYELRNKQTLEELMQAAGGETAIADDHRISIERVVDRMQRRAFAVIADAAGLATVLEDGDIVHVDAIASHYRGMVTLRGSVAHPGRFGWHEGMRVSELIPDRDSLVTRDYWWRRTQLGLPAREFSPAIASSPTAEIQQAVRDSTGTSRVSLMPAPAMTEALSASASLQQGDSSPGRPRQGEQQAAVSRPGAQTDWNYAVIERLNPATMRTDLLPFDPGRLVLEADRSQDLELMAGDVVTIFSQDEIQVPVDQQTKYVSLEGEFVHAGVYSVQPGESLQSLVRRAGGLTGKAYLYGSQFTRQSTKALEQQRLNDYVDRLQHQADHNSLVMASSATVSTQAGSDQAVADALSHNLIVRLRQMHANGRIVLRMRPDHSDSEELPDIALEDGDRLVIPPRPSTVQVIGAVLNQNAFVFREGGKAGDYLELAGGPSHDADRSAAFILRADGSVNGMSRRSTIWVSTSSEIGRQRLYPGDTIVIPEKMWRPSIMREILPWAQLFSELSLSSAAINILK